MRTVPDRLPPRRCHPCLHRRPYGNCGAVVAARLSPHPGVVIWAPPGHRCPAFQPSLTA